MKLEEGAVRVTWMWVAWSLARAALRRASSQSLVEEGVAVEGASTIVIWA